MICKCTNCTITENHEQNVCLYLTEYRPNKKLIKQANSEKQVDPISVLKVNT